MNPGKIASYCLVPAFLLVALYPVAPLLGFYLQQEKKEESPLEKSSKKAKKCIAVLLVLANPESENVAQATAKLLNKYESFYQAAKNSEERLEFLLETFKKVAMEAATKRTEIYIDSEEDLVEKFRVVWDGKQWVVKEVKKEEEILQAARYW